MTIKTKEDFKGKYIKIKKNISLKKLIKIRGKFKKIGCNLDWLTHKKENKYNHTHTQTEYYFISKYGSLNFCIEKASLIKKALQKISIKQFLKD